MTKTVLKIEGMMCEGCVAKVQSALQSLNGVDSVDVNLRKGTATTVHRGLSDETLITAVVDVGFRASVKRGLFS